MSMEEKIAELNRLKEKSKAGGGVERIEKEHKKGKLTAQERISSLLDPNTFQELDPFVEHRCVDFGLDKQKVLGDSVVAGYGSINGRKVFVYAQDATVFGGSMSEVSANKICKVMDLAAKTGVPIVGFLDGGGARIQEGVDAPYGYGQIFRRNILYSGVIPQISAVMGHCAGGATFSPALTDFVFMVKKTSQMYVNGPKVVEKVTGEEVSAEELGGAMVHSQRSGNCHFLVDNEKECFSAIRKLLSFLPQNSSEKTPFVDKGDNQEKEKEKDLISVIGDSESYDMKDVIGCIVDKRDFMEVYQNFAPSLIVGFARLGGYSVGIVASQPMNLSGMIDVDASDKGARFIRFCDCFNIPLITLIDTPGFRVGKAQEAMGLIRHGVKLAYAYAEATVPKIVVIIGKAYGTAYVVMSSKGLGSDINYALPTAKIAVMGAEEAVNIIFRKEIAQSENPEELYQKLIGEYRDKFSTSYEAAKRGYVDEVIDPKDIRFKLIESLKILENKREANPFFKKHGNIV